MEQKETRAEKKMNEVKLYLPFVHIGGQALRNSLVCIYSNLLCSDEWGSRGLSIGVDLLSHTLGEFFGIKGLAFGPNSNKTMPTRGFEAAMWSEMQTPKLLSNVSPPADIRYYYFIE